MWKLAAVSLVGTFARLSDKIAIVAAGRRAGPLSE
jgi:hypothetical protein